MLTKLHLLQVENQVENNTWVHILITFNIQILYMQIINEIKF